MSKLATILGILLGVIMVTLNMVDYTQMKFITAFFDWQSLGVVLGGVVAAILVNYPFYTLGCVFRAFWIVLSREPLQQSLTIELLVDLAAISQRRGKIALEETIDEMDHHFLKVALTEMLSTNDPVVLQRHLETELNSMRLRHQRCQEVFFNMASYAPAFGMLGTVMGLIIMMASQADSSSAAVLGSSQSDDVMAKLLSGMGIALVTTFYGVLLSNLFFLPIAGKLKTLSEHEVRVDEIIIVGMLALQRQDSPLRMKDTLLNFVSERMRIQLEQQVMPSRPS